MKDFTIQKSAKDLKYFSHTFRLIMILKRKVNKDIPQYIRKNVREAYKLKKASLLLIISILSIVSIFLLVPYGAHGDPTSQVKVDKIDHVVSPIYGGLLLINDTFTVSSTVENTTITDFSIGFPLKYGANLRYCGVYNATNFDESFEVLLNTGLGVTGYYGVTVVFPDEVRNLLYNGQTYTFTVVFLFSDLINSSSGDLFKADFPVYPSLAQDAAICNVTVVLPKKTEYGQSNFPFNTTQQSGRYYLTYLKTDLPKLTRVSTEISFTQESADEFACFSIIRLDREITADSTFDIPFSDLFVLKSKTRFTINNIRLMLPENSSNIAAYDEQGKKLTTVLHENETNIYRISLTIVEGQSRSFRLTYTLPKEDHLIQLDSQDYMLTLALSENLRVLPKTFNIKIVFPEGAVIQSFPQQTFSIQRDVFRETLSLSLHNITWLHNEQWSFTYGYSIFWSSFRPTLWTTALVIIGSIIAFAWQRPKTPVVVSTILVSRRVLNEFVETYEEKKRVVSELEETRQKAIKGKVSRRHYKIRKTTLENRLSSLSKKLTDLRKEIMSGGAKYADIMRQLEVTEIELENIEEDIRRIEVRFKRGEISAQTYRRLLENDIKRQERARTTIDGILLRLRE